MLDLSIYLLQLVALLITSLLGLVGIIYDFKDPSGKLTSVGRKVVLGIVASSLTSVVASGLDFYKRNEDERENLQRTRRQLATSTAILNDVNRGLHPIRTVNCEVRLALDDQAREVRALRQQLQALATGPSSLRAARNRDVTAERNAIGHITHLTIDEASPYFPHASQYPQLGGLLTHPLASLDLFRAHRPLPSTYTADKHGGLFMKRDADLSLLLKRKAGKPATLIYDAEEQQCYVELALVLDASEDFPNMGTISSTLDLTHAQAGLVIGPATVHGAFNVIKSVSSVVLLISGKSYYAATDLLQQQGVGKNQALLFDLNQADN